jgi:hypothetical protein
MREEKGRSVDLEYLKAAIKNLKSHLMRQIIFCQETMMKQYKRLLTVLMLITPLSLPSFAAEAQKAHTHQHAEGQKTQGTVGTDMDKSMQDMQDSMLKMHDLMNRILQAKAPQEVQRLKQEHLQLMKKHMQMTHERMPMMHGMAKKNPTQTKPGHTHETAPTYQEYQN